MKPAIVLLVLTLVAPIPAAPPAATPASDPLRVQVVTGGHDYHMSFYSALEDPAFHVNLRPHPGVFDGDLRSRVDVLVFYDMAQARDIGERGQANLRSFLESGKGLVILHHAMFDYLDWDWYTREVSGVRQDENRDRSRPDYLHGVKQEIRTVARHPMLSGVGPFTIVDETYRGLIFAPQDTILLRTDHASSDGPVMWVSPYPKSRVVGIQLGHDESAHLDPNYKRLVRNAILWAGGRLK
jgi:type 1 glutamine amidotransferase